MSIPISSSTSHPTTSRAVRRLASLITLAVAVAGLLVGGAGSASAANAGYVTCMNSANVVGVWVNVSGGRSGWAARSGSGSQQRWSYDTQGRSYSLTVGCGGTPSSWASSSSTRSYTPTWSNVSCYPGWSWGGASYYVHDGCF